MEEQNRDNGGLEGEEIETKRGEIFQKETKKEEKERKRNEWVEKSIEREITETGCVCVCGEGKVAYFRLSMFFSCNNWQVHPIINS